MGVRWPLHEVVVVTKDKAIKDAIDSLNDIIKTQTNIKEVSVQESLPGIKLKIKADFKVLGPDFGNKAPGIIAKLNLESSKTILRNIEKNGSHKMLINNEKIELTEKHLIIDREVPFLYVEGTFKKGFIYLNKDVDEKLLAEGYSREVMRRVQSLRKNSGLQKNNLISLFIKTNSKLKNMLKKYEKAIKEKVGAKVIKISDLDPSRKHKFNSIEKVKDFKIEIFFDTVS